MADLPAHVRADVQRLADAVARRLLAEQMNADPIGATARRDDSPVNRRPDERALLVEW